MEANGGKRCPHYQLFAQPLNMDGEPNFITVRRCMLSERLIGLLTKTEDGGLLTSKLSVRIQTGKEVAIAGPDLEAVTQSSCTVERCEERCTPAYSAHLERFSSSDPNQGQVTCHSEEEGEEQSDARQEETSAP